MPFRKRGTGQCAAGHTSRPNVPVAARPKSEYTMNTAVNAAAKTAVNTKSIRTAWMSNSILPILIRGDDLNATNRAVACSHPHNDASSMRTGWGAEFVPPCTFGVSVRNSHSSSYSVLGWVACRVLCGMVSRCCSCRMTDGLRYSLLSCGGMPVMERTLTSWLVIIHWLPNPPPPTLYSLTIGWSCWPMCLCVAAVMLFSTFVSLLFAVRASIAWGAA